MARELKRQKELSYLLMDYLTDWTDNDEDCWTIEKSIEEIKLYGATFDEPNDKLVKSSIRHLIYVINPWNVEAVPEILQAIGFSETEIELWKLTLL